MVAGVGNTTANRGGGATHTHGLTIAEQSGHTHDVTVATMPPWYALCFIQHVS